MFFSQSSVKFGFFAFNVFLGPSVVSVNNRRYGRLDETSMRHHAELWIGNACCLLFRFGWLNLAHRC